MENQVAAWTAEVDKLPLDKNLAQKRPAPGAGSSWRGDRRLVIAADALAKPGYYVLAAEANGEAAFAPIRVQEAK